MLIPIIGSGLSTKEEGEEGRVVGVIMVASTERTYTAGSLSELMCMSVPPPGSVQLIPCVLSNVLASSSSSP